MMEGGHMNTTLREVSQLGSGFDTSKTSAERNNGFRRMASAATQMIARRRTDLRIEQEAERSMFWQLLKREVERSRRQASSFTVLCLQPAASDMRSLAARMEPALRSTDAAVAERDRILVLLADTTADEATHAARRLSATTDLPLDDRAWQRIEFPRDALTLGALVDALLHPDLGARVLLAG